MERMFLSRPSVDDVDSQPSVQERLRFGPFEYRLQGEGGAGKDLFIGQKRNGRPMLALRNARELFYFPYRHPTAELHPMVSPVAADFYDGRFGEGVDHRHTDTVKPTGGVVGFIGKLSARVKRRQNDLQRRFVVLRMFIDRDTPPVIFHRAGPVVAQGDDDMVAIAVDRLVDGIVERFPHQMMQSVGVGPSDIHAGPNPNRLQPFEDFNMFRRIALFRHASSRFS